MFTLLTKLCELIYEYNTFPLLFQNFLYLIFFQDFSKPGNNHL